MLDIMLLAESHKCVYSAKIASSKRSLLSITCKFSTSRAQQRSSKWIS